MCDQFKYVKGSCSCATVDVMLTSPRSEAGNADLGFEYNNSDNVRILIRFFYEKFECHIS